MDYDKLVEYLEHYSKLSLENLKTTIRNAPYDAKEFFKVEIIEIVENLKDNTVLYNVLRVRDFMTSINRKTDEYWKQTFKDTDIGCNGLTIYANIDKLNTVIPKTILGVTVRVLKKDGFQAIYYNLLSKILTSFIGEYMLDQLRESPAYLLLICKDNKVEAFKLIYENPNFTGEWDISGGLENLARKPGLGRILMNASEEIARFYNITKIIIGSASIAIGFYQKMGFELTPDKNSPHSNLMVKQLSTKRRRLR